MKAFTIGGIILVLLVPTACSALPSDQVASPTFQLSDLSAADWQQRWAGYTKIRADQEALKRPDIKAALIDLLDRENRVIHFPFVNSKGEIVGASGKYGEGYSEYYSHLADTVAQIADWQDPHQLCVLAEGSYNPDSRFAAKLAVEGGAAVAPCLLKRAQSNISDRRESIPVLVQLSAVTKGLSPAFQQQVRQAIIGGLRDSDVLLRQTTVQAVGKYGSAEMIPILQDIARSDPVSRPLDNGTRRFSVREAAARAIQSIQERAGAK